MVGVGFKQKCADWRNILEKAGVYAPAFELSQIITHATGISHAVQVSTCGQPEVTPCEAKGLQPRMEAVQVSTCGQSEVMPCEAKGPQPRMEAVQVSTCGQPEVMPCEAKGLQPRMGMPLSCKQISDIDEIIKRRISGEPLQYIIGKWEFYGLEFYVGEGVLIPRADTETLVETALRLCVGSSSPKIADYCSGTGCVAISLAHYLPNAELTAVELSPQACEYLLKNIELNHAANVSLLIADVLTNFWAGEAELDMIVSNPPYICTSELEGLQREVQYEPKMALDGAEDGLLFYKKIAKNSKGHLKKGGWLILEVGDTQSKEVCEILAENGYENIKTEKDLAGFNRVAYAQRGYA